MTLIFLFDILSFTLTFLYHLMKLTTEMCFSFYNVDLKHVRGEEIFIKKNRNIFKRLLFGSFPIWWMDKESIRQLPSLRKDNRTCTCRVNSSEVDSYFCRFPVKWSTIHGLMKHPKLGWCVLSNMYNLSSDEMTEWTRVGDIERGEWPSLSSHSWFDRK